MSQASLFADVELGNRELENEKSLLYTRHYFTRLNICRPFLLSSTPVMPFTLFSTSRADSIPDSPARQLSSISVRRGTTAELFHATTPFLQLCNSVATRKAIPMATSAIGRMIHAQLTRTYCSGVIVRPGTLIPLGLWPRAYVILSPIRCITCVKFVALFSAKPNVSSMDEVNTEPKNSPTLPLSLGRMLKLVFPGNAGLLSLETLKVTQLMASKGFLTPTSSKSVAVPGWKVPFTTVVLCSWRATQRRLHSVTSGASSLYGAVILAAANCNRVLLRTRPNWILECKARFSMVYTISAPLFKSNARLVTVNGTISRPWPWPANVKTLLPAPT